MRKKEKIQREREFKAIQNNNDAKNSKRKLRYSIQDIKHWKPKTANQKKIVTEYHADQNICATGSVGTGKTFVAIALAMQDVLDGSQLVDKLMVIRSCVPTRDSGFIPGNMDEKCAPYEEPYEDIVNEIFEYHLAWDDLKTLGYIEFRPTTYLRGLTWNNAVILIDEPQNMNFSELMSVVTRAGINSKIIMCGDTNQVDLNPRKEESGYDDWLKIAETIKLFSIIDFVAADIVRCPLVKEIIEAVENYTIDDVKSGFVAFSDMPLKDLLQEQQVMINLSSVNNGHSVWMCHDAYRDLVNVSNEIIRRKETDDDKGNVVSLVNSEDKKTDS